MSHTRPPSFLGDHRFWGIGPAGQIHPIADPLADLVVESEGHDDPESYRETALADAGYDTMAPEFFGAVDPVAPAPESEVEERAGVQVDVYAAAEGASAVLGSPAGQFPFVVRLIFTERLFWFYASDLGRLLTVLNLLLPLAEASLARQQAEWRQAQLAAGADTSIAALAGKVIAVASRHFGSRELAQELAEATTPEDRVLVLARYQRFDEAEAEIARAEAELDSSDDTAARRARLTQARGHVALHRQDMRAAVEQYRDASQQLDGAGRPDEALRQEVLIQLSHALILTNKLDEAHQVIEEALQLARARRGQKVNEKLLLPLVWCLHVRADLRLRQHRAGGDSQLLDQAEADYREAQGLLAAGRVRDHPLITYCRDGLRQISEARSGQETSPGVFQVKTA